MKQFLTILLLFLYSFSSIGATVKAHLCAGKVQKCFCGKSNKKDTCCAEKTTYLKKQDLHASSNVQSLKHAVYILATPVAFYTLLTLPVVEQKTIGLVHTKKKPTFYRAPNLYFGLPLLNLILL